ncbi:hypothetical protein GCM10010844_35860 [Deinococcus radiotolerans]|uniref:Uncharacterized protein n=1 Tax=Deinococcus radiotolerans TaxID=1309407 RepID=A0ABQ2FPE0_9DEIO|nr:hypothetical protein GCM10010844_35860 [Deinococcus radiotolerans]
MDRKEGDRLFQIGALRPATFVNLRPEGQVVAIEHLFGDRRDLIQLRQLHQDVKREDITVTVLSVDRCRLVFDDQHALLEFDFVDGPGTHNHVVRLSNNGVSVCFDGQSRWSGILFTDVVFDDTLTAIEAWSREHHVSEE